MKHLNKLITVVVLLVGLLSQAQDANNSWSLSFGANAVDTRVSAASNLNDQFSDYFNTKDNWNFLPSVSYLNVSKYAGDNFSFGVTGSINKMSKFVNKKATDGTYSVVNPGDYNYYGVDLDIKYSFMNMLGSKYFNPTAHIGGGYTFLGDLSAGTVNTGIGLTYWMNDAVGLSLQSTYKYSFDNERIPGIDVPTHMQHFLGITFKFGGIDTDGDGIVDKDDNCVSVAGPRANGGCPWPDTDGDGVLDKDDNCKNEVGPASNGGCPEPVITKVAEKKMGEFAKTILFNSSRSSFKSGSTDKLDGIVGIMKEFSKATFLIEGHTDSTGSVSLNEKLSAKRAAAVKDYLVQNGIDASRLESKGFGESNPVDSNKTRDGRANNRRVEIKVTNE